MTPLFKALTVERAKLRTTNRHIADYLIFAFSRVLCRVDADSAETARRKYFVTWKLMRMLSQEDEVDANDYDHIDDDGGGVEETEDDKLFRAFKGKC